MDCYHDCVDFDRGLHVMLRAFTLLLLAGIPMFADLTGRWTAGGEAVFVLIQKGDALTGTIESGAAKPNYKIVDGTVRGNQIHFFVLHEDESDPEVKVNGGDAFHNTAKGTFTEDEIVVSGSRENTTIRQYRLVLKRIKN